MQFELLDRYLLAGSPPKAEVVRDLLAAPPGLAAAQPFLEGMRLLGERTPDLTLIALRLVLSGRRADDASVVAVREAVERSRGGDPAGRTAYEALLGISH